jgi:hypothetical protein
VIIHAKFYSFMISRKIIDKKIKNSSKKFFPKIIIKIKIFISK